MGRKRRQRAFEGGGGDVGSCGSVGMVDWQLRAHRDEAEGKGDVGSCGLIDEDWLLHDSGGGKGGGRDNVRASGSGEVLPEGLEYSCKVGPRY